jgi:hypothetical protein
MLVVTACIRMSKSCATTRSALPGQYYCSRGAAQDVLQVPSTHARDQGPRTLVPRKQDPPRRGLHSQRSKFADAPSHQRGPDMWSLQQPTQQESSCTWSSRRWARWSAQTPSLTGRAQWLQDSPLRSTVDTVQLLTACSSIGRHPSRFGSTRHGIYCLKFWKNFERQGQNVFSSFYLRAAISDCLLIGAATLAEACAKKRAAGS